MNSRTHCLTIIVSSGGCVYDLRLPQYRLPETSYDYVSSGGCVYDLE